MQDPLLVAIVGGLVSGLIVGCAVILGQALVDDARSGREIAAAQLLADEAACRENLRFVRDRSSEEAVERNFQDIDLREQPLAGLNLTAAEFLGADLTGANLTGTIINRGDFRGSNLNDTWLVGTKLSGGVFRNATLYRAWITAADFTDSDLRGANLSYAETQVSQRSTGMKVAQENLKHRTIFRNADLTDAQLQRADLSNADLRGAILTGADLTGAVFDDGDERFVLFDNTTKWPLDFIPPRRQFSTSSMHYSSSSS